MSLVAPGHRKAGVRPGPASPCPAPSALLAQRGGGLQCGSEEAGAVGVRLHEGSCRPLRCGSVCGVCGFVYVVVCVPVCGCGVSACSCVCVWLFVCLWVVVCVAVALCVWLCLWLCVIVFVCL